MARPFFNKAQRERFTKALSLTLCLAFIFSSSVTPAAASVENPAAQAESARVAQLTPPSELGTVVDAHIASQDLSSPLVIHIQDLHANFDVQTKIARLIEFYDSHLPPYKVAVEGAEGPITATQLGKVSDRAFKTKVCDRLMKNAEITGTEYFSIVNGKPDLLWGVEDHRYHEANIALFRSTYKGKRELARALGKLQAEFAPIKQKAYSRSMRRLDRKAAAYESGKIDIVKYIRVLVKQASKQGIDIAGRYPEIAKWTGYAKADQYANMDKLMTEQAALLTEVQTSLAKTDLQRNIASTSVELDVLRRMLTEEVTTEEVRHLAPELSQVAGRAQFLMDQAGVSYEKQGAADLVSASLDFYAVALLRDQHLTENALKLIQSPTSKTHHVILVAGGFHTPGITKILNQKGVSYITVAPNVTTHTARDKQLYVARLMGRHGDPDDMAAGNDMLSWMLNTPFGEWVVARTALRTAQADKNPQMAREVTDVFGAQTALAVNPPPRGKLRDYTGAGNTSIHIALDRARGLFDSDKSAAALLLWELRDDIALAMKSNDIVPLMDKWNERYPLSSVSDPGVDLMLSDLPRAFEDANLLLSSLPPEIVGEAALAIAARVQAAAAAKQREGAVAKRVTATVLEYNVGHLFGDGTFTLTDAVLDAARKVLQELKDAGVIKDFVVNGFGQDLHMQINTYGRGTQDLTVQSVGLKAAQAAVRAGKEAGLLRPVTLDDITADFFDLNAAMQVEALLTRHSELPFTERGAEPISVSKAIGGGIGFFNRALVNLYFSENVSGPRLEGAGVFFTVESAADIRAGNKNRKVYVFGDTPSWPEDGIDLVRPNSDRPLHVRKDQIGTFKQMSVLIGDPTTWVVTAVYAAQGRMAESKETRVEPIAVVGVERVYPTNTAIPTSPVLIVRGQGGAPAIGETHMATSKFYFGPGGDHEGYYTGLLPVTLEQARSMPDTHMVTKVATYHYQSKKKGEMPHGDIYDQMAADTKETVALQTSAMGLVREAAEVDNMVPFMTTDEAERQMAPVRTRVADRFEPVPDYKKGEKDPKVDSANALSKGRTLSDIKADAGGKVGHTVVPSYFIPVAEASLQAAKESGLIDDYKVFYAGDDLHLLITHNHGIDSSIVHTLAWETFMRIIWVAKSLEDKWYGLGQDFPNMRGRPVHQDAKLNDAFMALLKEKLPREQLMQWGVLEYAYKNQTPVQGESPFSGNVQGQGPGFAEINIPDEGPVTFGIFAADKAGPDAFNVPLWYALRKAAEEGTLSRQFGDVIAEVWDIHHAQRGDFSYANEKATLQALLAPTHLNSVKRIWQAGASRILAALSVEKLGIIAGGEYVGKDDPVLIATPEIIKGFFQFARDHFYMTQGNARGSHNAAPKPRSLRDGIATVNSKPVQLGLMVQVDGKNGLIVKDMFDDPTFQNAYDRVDRINKEVWNAQGLSGGLVSVPAAQVEANYPLRKELEKITGENSPHAIATTVTTREVYNQIAAANRPIRSLAFLALGVAMTFFGPVMAVVGSIYAAYHLVAFGAGMFQTHGNLFARAATHDNWKNVSFALFGEEAAHEGLSRIPIVGAWLSGDLRSTVPANRRVLGALAGAWDETFGEVFSNAVAPLLMLTAALSALLVRPIVNRGLVPDARINSGLVGGIEALSQAKAMLMDLTQLTEWAIQSLRNAGVSAREIEAIQQRGRQAILRAA